MPKLDQSRDQRLASIPGLPPDLSQTITNCRFAPRCRYATDRCRSEDPPLVDSDDRGDLVHRYACFHPVAPGARPELPSTVGADETAAPSATPSAAVVPLSAAEGVRSAALARAPQILDVQDLVKEFPVMSGAVFRRQVGSVKAVSGVTLHHPEG